MLLQCGKALLELRLQIGGHANDSRLGRRSCRLSAGHQLGRADKHDRIVLVIVLRVDDVHQILPGHDLCAATARMGDAAPKLVAQTIEMELVAVVVVGRFHAAHLGGDQLQRIAWPDQDFVQIVRFRRLLFAGSRTATPDQVVSRGACCNENVNWNGSY